MQWYEAESRIWKCLCRAKESTKHMKKLSIYFIDYTQQHEEILVNILVSLFMWCKRNGCMIYQCSVCIYILLEYISKYHIKCLVYDNNGNTNIFTNVSCSITKQKIPSIYYIENHSHSNNAIKACFTEIATTTKYGCSMLGMAHMSSW